MKKLLLATALLALMTSEGMANNLLFSSLPPAANKDKCSKNIVIKFTKDQKTLMKIAGKEANHELTLSDKKKTDTFDLEVETNLPAKAYLNITSARGFKLFPEDSDQSYAGLSIPYTLKLAVLLLMLRIQLRRFLLVCRR